MLTERSNIAAKATLETWRIMPVFLVRYVHFVEKWNERIGRLAMYLLFVLMAVLMWGAFARAAWHPQIWTDEMGQFLLAGYFMLGGAYALQMGSAVRMDVFYSEWSPRTRAMVDAVTIFALLIYLGVLLWGGIESTAYALEYGERKSGLWRPYMAPVKIVMCIGITMMLAQCTAFLLRDIAKLRGHEI
jgi:TRAP-type mannitol/chloroaromatic compound transport system permease small subunit